MTHVAVFPARPALDPRRIAANAVTIAVHVVALGLLLVPLQTPVPDIAADDTTTLDFPPDRPVVVLPPDPPKPTPTPETRPQPTPPVTTPVPLTVQDPLPLVSDGTEPVTDDPLPVPTDSFDTGPVGPIDASTLATLDSPRPRYPRDALLSGREGELLLRLTIEADGRVSRVLLERSSGHRDLDLEARRHVLTRWRFAPRPGEGAIEALLPVVFRIEN
jgi:protein TonB